MTPLKIVLVSANCFPILGPRAHRTTELAKEFVRQGHYVTIYSLLGEYDYTAYSKTSGINFKNLGRSKFGLLDNSGIRRNNFINKIFRRLFGKLLVFPQIELTFKVKRVIEKETNIDLLITVAQPHTIHWGIPFLKKNYKYWIADCGDPFMGDPFNKYPFYFKYIEKKWCEKADFITVPIEEGKKGYYPQFKNKIKIIPQGFDFRKVKLAKYEKNNIPTFAYSGIIYKDRRDPKLFIKYLVTLEIDFKFIVYTKSVQYFQKFKPLLNNKLEIRDYIPRQELLFELSKMDFLINIKNESSVQQPSKLIDYSLTKRPIINISTDFKEEEIFNSFLNGDYSSQKEIEDINKYNIETVAHSFLKIIN